MRVLLIPGLGYNQRIFERFSLEGVQLECINWIEPIEKESLSSYAKRLYATYAEGKEDTILIGHSFGGIVAQEIASLYPVKKIILLSSIKSRAEMPWYFKIAHHLYLDRLMIKRLILWVFPKHAKSHGFATASDEAMFKDMLNQVSNNYLQWSLRKLSQWEEPALPSSTSLFQIHGTMDKTFPFSLIKDPDKVIKNGSHIFVYKQGVKASKLVKEALGGE